MPDLKEFILNVIKPRQMSSFATLTQDGNPWVRYVMTKGNDDLEMRFSSHVSARKIKQIQANPEVHITCGISDPMVMSPYVQVQGRAQLTTDKAEREAFWHDMLENIFTGPDDPDYGIVVVKPYRIEYCAPGSQEPQVWEAEHP